MKNVFSFLIIVLFISCTHSKKAVNYTTTKDGSRTVLKGIINRSIIENDTTFKWFKENMKYGMPDAAAVEAFKNKQDAFSLIVFGGTWCEDTQNLWPRFFQLIDKSGFPEKKIQLITVDLKKHTINNLHSQFAIQNVPTFIVMHRGKEIGRVVEYGTMGDITKELGAIVNGIQ